MTEGSNKSSCQIMEKCLVWERVASSPQQRGAGESETIRANAFPFHSPRSQYFNMNMSSSYFALAIQTKPFDIQTELTSAIMDRILSGVQLWS